MDENKMQKRSLAFLNWADKNFYDWIQMSIGLRAYPIGDLEIEEILKTACRNSQAEMFFSYFLVAQAEQVFGAARERFFLQLMRRNIERRGIRAVLDDFGRVFSENKARWKDRL